MKNFCEIYKDSYAFIYLNRKAQKVFENEIGIQLKGDYGDCKKVYHKYGMSVAFIKEDFSGLGIDVPDGWIIIDELGEVEGAGGKYESFLHDDFETKILDEMINEDKKRIRNRKYDVVYSNEPIYEGERQADRLSMYETLKIYEAIMQGPRRLEKLTECAVVELISLRNELILSAIHYCRIRMDFSSLSYQKVLPRTNEQTERCDFIDLFKKYWIDAGIKDVAEPWIEDFVDSLNRRQLGDVACYIAYEQAMGVR